MQLRHAGANPARGVGRAERDAEFLSAETARQLYDLLIGSIKRQSEVRRNGWESNNLTSVQTISTSATTYEELRVTFVYAYCASISTLQLGSVYLTLPAGASALPLGDDQYGGVILSPRDVRSLTTAGAAGAMSLFLSGEILERSGRN